jgi:tRNA (guanine37-N1)-methyltransferase
VVSGGEVPALLVLEAVTRFVPGVLGQPGAAEGDSFAVGRLEPPYYTRPLEFRGLRVPDVLVSGHHEGIARWRADRAREVTRAKRPDLLEPGDDAQDACRGEEG